MRMHAYACGPCNDKKQTRHTFRQDRYIPFEAFATLPAMTWWQRFKQWAQRFKREIAALTLALMDPRTPWYAKALAGVIVAYALSPIDLIPDIIPVLGLLDEMILLPLLIAATLRLIPTAVVAECRQRAEQGDTGAPAWLGRAGLSVIVALWLVLAAIVARWLWAD